ncbi:MAG TPA: hemolysin family protein [Armatimonadota bacterium]|nr:hemolysin family protein [Armatimonadota bacterium]
MDDGLSFIWLTAAVWADLRVGGVVQMVVIALALLLLGFVSLAEAALVSVNQVRVRQLATEGDSRAALLVDLVERRQEILGSLVIAINFSILVTSSLVTALTIQLWGVGWVPVSSVVTLALVITCCEIAPKSYSAHQADRVALRVARAVALLHRVLRPAASVLNRIAQFLMARVLIRLLGGGSHPREHAFSDDEIKRLVTAGERGGEVQEEEAELIHGVIEFADKVAREVMVPRTDMVCLPQEASPAEAVLVIAQHGHSRIPVYDGDLDHISGIVYAKDLLARLQQGRPAPSLAAVARPVHCVPENKKLADLLREMQLRRVHMAIVIDEYGGTAGLVTVEDLLEEIVGEIVDEYDREEEQIRMTGAGEGVVDARASVDDVEEAFAVELPEGEFDSIGGFVLDRMGHLPQAGEELEHSGLRIRVQEVNALRIHKLHVARVSPPPAQAEQTDADAR